MPKLIDEEQFKQCGKESEVEKVEDKNKGKNGGNSTSGAAAKIKNKPPGKKNRGRRGARKDGQSKWFRKIIWSIFSFQWLVKKNTNAAAGHKENKGPGCAIVK